MDLEYEGTDITQDVTVDTAWHDMYSDGHTDTLYLRLADTQRLWDSWGPKAGDRIRARDGSADTGLMWVDMVKPQSSLITVRALAMPPEATKTRRSKAWEQVRLSQLWTEVCTRYGLSADMHDVTDFVYAYVTQNAVPDFEFLQRRFALEGYGLLCYDGKLVIYNARVMDSQSPATTITLAPGMTYDLASDEDKRFGSVIVTDGTTTGSYSIGDGREYRAVLNDRISNQAEADRFARNVLRLKNRDTRRIKFKSEKIIRELAAGSVFNLDPTASPSWNGPAFIEHMRIDYVHKNSTVWARQAITDY